MDYFLLVLNAGYDFLVSTLSTSSDSFWVGLVFLFALYHCLVVPFWSFLHVKN